MLKIRRQSAWICHLSLLVCRVDIEEPLHNIQHAWYTSMYLLETRQPSLFSKFQIICHKIICGSIICCITLHDGLDFLTMFLFFSFCFTLFHQKNISNYIWRRHIRLQQKTISGIRITQGENSVNDVSFKTCNFVRARTVWDKKTPNKLKHMLLLLQLLSVSILSLCLSAIQKESLTNKSFSVWRQKMTPRTPNVG